MYQAKDVVTSEAEIRTTLGEVGEASAKKIIDHLDVHCRSWIAHSPFVVISSSGRDGRVDVSPKGDPAGFVKVLDEKTVAIPDRLGNRRADTFLNVLANPRIGIMFVIPMRGEVLRVGGTAQIVRDPELLSAMTVKGQAPTLALLVRVDEAMFHCGKSMIRSGMWQPKRWGPIDKLPSYAQALVAHGELTRSVAEMQQGISDNETERLY